MASSVTRWAAAIIDHRFRAGPRDAETRMAEDIELRHRADPVCGARVIGLHGVAGSQGRFDIANPGRITPGPPSSIAGA